MSRSQSQGKWWQRPGESLRNPKGAFLCFDSKPHFEDSILCYTGFLFSFFILTICFSFDFFFCSRHIFFKECLSFLSFHRTGQMGSLMVACQPRVNLSCRYLSKPWVYSFLLSWSKAVREGQDLSSRETYLNICFLISLIILHKTLDFQSLELPLTTTL